MFRFNKISRLSAYRHQIRRASTEAGPNRPRPNMNANPGMGSSNMGGSSPGMGPMTSNISKNQQWAMLAAGSAIAGWAVWRYYIHPKNRHVAKAPKSALEQDKIQRSDMEPLTPKRQTTRGSQE
mmetsp:Transcript_3598/g.13755  ORF Transcript_3598/g.13755 Transcript_3598/m.13755 type:complete len:124 (+) Transcript_3598:3115-3486(+)